jgi:hypothetical protein
LNAKNVDLQRWIGPLSKVITLEIGKNPGKTPEFNVGNCVGTLLM